MEKKHDFPEDQGQTIADMSEVSAPRLWLGRRKTAQPPQTPEESQRPWEDHTLKGKERSWFIFGALKAALLIALAFILGLGLVILLLTLLYH